MHKALTILIDALLTASEQELELAKAASPANDRDFIVHMTVSAICSRLAGTYMEVRKQL